MEQSQQALPFYQQISVPSFQLSQDLLSLSLASQPAAGVVSTNAQSLPQDSGAVSVRPDVMRHPPSKHFSSWYTNEISPTCMSPATEAFKKAIEVLQRDMSRSDCEIIWLRGKNSMLDVQKALLDAETTYKNQSSKSKIRTVLASCSSRVAYYAPILDTLCQHYPEYTSLAWGAFKFFFTVMINFEELLIEFSKATATIANVLPRTRLLYELYPTEAIQTAVANVYAKIVEFVLETVKWYKKNRLQHAIAAVVSPYKLSFKNIVDEIAERSRMVDELANTAVKAELRDVHLKVNTLYDENVSLRSHTLDMRHELLQMKQQFHLMAQTMIETRTLQHEMMLNQQGQSMMMLEWQTENVRQALGSSGSVYGNTDEMLAFCRSMRNRRRLRTPSLLPRSDVGLLKAWVENRQSSVLVARGQGLRNSSIDFATDFLDAALDSSVPAIWVLPSSFEERPTLVGILQCLVLQIMSAKGGGNFDVVTLQDLRAATTVPHWLVILERCSKRLEKAYVVLDMSLIQKSTTQEFDESENWDAHMFLDRLRGILKRRAGGWVKVVLVSWMTDMLESLTWDSSQDLVRISTDRGIIRERRLWVPKFRGLARRNMTVSLQQLRQAVGIPPRR